MTRFPLRRVARVAVAPPATLVALAAVAAFFVVVARVAVLVVVFFVPLAVVRFGVLVARRVTACRGCRSSYSAIEPYPSTVHAT
jgi:hypothetical protein